jgi:hypothetical protein
MCLASAFVESIFSLQMLDSLIYFLSIMMNRVKEKAARAFLSNHQTCFTYHETLKSFKLR